MIIKILEVFLFTIKWKIENVFALHARSICWKEFCFNLKHIISVPNVCSSTPFLRVNIFYAIIRYKTVSCWKNGALSLMVIITLLKIGTHFRYITIWNHEHNLFFQTLKCTIENSTMFDQNSSFGRSTLWERQIRYS